MPEPQRTHDIAPQWIEQLAEGGRLIVPLLIHGYSRGIAFDKRGGRLVSRSLTVCGIVPMQGAGHRTRAATARRTDRRALRRRRAPTTPLPDTFDTARTELWTGVTILDNVPFDTLQLWLATTTTGFCRLDITPGMDPAVVSPPERNDAATIITGTSLAYMTWVKTSTDTDGRSTWEFVIHAYGPHAEPLAQHMADQIRTWDREHRHSPGPRVTVYPRSTPDALPADGWVVDKRHVRLVLTWTGTDQG